MCLDSRQDCLFSCMSLRLRKAADCYCVCLNGLVNGFEWMEALCLYIMEVCYYSFFVVVEKPRSPGRVQLEEDLIKQTQPGVEGFPLSLKNPVLLSSCQQQL